MKKYAILNECDSLTKTIHTINEVSSSGGVPGIAIVLDEEEKVHGVITDGDLRNLYCKKVDFEAPIKSFVTKKFVYVYSDLENKDQIKMAFEQFHKRSKNDPRVSRVVICDREKRFIDLVDLFDLYRSGDASLRKIGIYGLGFVGLTLGLTLAELDLDVIGVDLNPHLITNLQKGVPPFFENGLDSLLNYCLKENKIEFKCIEESFHADIHIISVGTPLNQEGGINYDYLLNAGDSIGEKLKEGDLVICRSTVPVGTTRNKLVPKLEKVSGLKGGEDFHVAFAPERTVEGNALKELKTLPQVIGGLTPQCVDLTVKLFERLNSTIVKLESLESAEVVKLINNTFRDTVFSFANDVALLCEEYNINSFEVIKAANEGYPRNPIPLPSPGVGGICLAKDPFLYSGSKKTDRPSYGQISREINRSMPSNILKKFKKFCHVNQVTPSKIHVVGLAFKGIPETSDTRFSPAVELIEELKREGIAEIYGTDFVVPSDELKELGVIPVSLEKGMNKAQAAFFMNNHPEHSKLDVYQVLSDKQKAQPGPFFLFDGWNQFSKNELESIPQISYGTLGYMTGNSVS